MVSRTPEPATSLGKPQAGERCVTDDAARALHYLRLLGHEDHPDAEKDPLYALYQVAVDLRCTAHGYRALYFHRQELESEE